MCKTVDTYLAYPKDNKTDIAILILCDVIGNKFINAQLIADQFAANGYFVVVPDLFNGDPIPLNRGPDFDMTAWREKHTTETVDPIMTAVIKALKEEYGVKKIGGAGYCFGAKPLVRFLKKGAIDAGYVAHPSWVTADEVRAIEGPLSIAASETDGIFPPEKRHLTEEILKETKQPFQINLYSGCSHGFAVRGDITNKQIKFAKEQAFLQAVFWYDEHLRNE